MPRTSRRRRFIKMLNRNLQQRKSLVAMSMLSDDSSSSSDDGGSSSSSSDSTTGAIIFAAAYNSSKKKLEFAEKSRYLFRAGYRKSNQDVFINDLNTGSGDERPWLTEDEFKKKYRMSREALDFITDKIKDDKVFKNKRGPKQMNPKHQLMRAYFKIGHGSVKNCRKRARKAILRCVEEKYYNWPDENERRKIAKWFKKEFNLPNCVGVMDGTLFPLEFEPETEDAGDYHGRKFQWSLTCLVISDQKRRIRCYLDWQTRYTCLIASFPASPMREEKSSSSSYRSQHQVQQTADRLVKENSQGDVISRYVRRYGSNREGLSPNEEVREQSRRQQVETAKCGSILDCKEEDGRVC
eukprot:scaffold11300_cov124-Skeletonema_marinoi.AAC.2